MGMPANPVNLTAEQVAALNSQLADMRHDVNNYLSLMMAAIEMTRIKPDTAERMLKSISEQPPKVVEAMTKFSKEWESVMRAGSA